MSDIEDTPVDLLPHFLHSGHHESARPVPRHSHPGMELVLITRGSCLLQVEGNVWRRGKQGDLFIMPAHRPHRQRSEGRVKTTYVVFRVTPGMLSDDMRRLSLSATDPLARWMEDLCMSDHPRTPSHTYMQSGLLLACVSRIGELIEHEMRMAELHPAMERAFAYIHGHYTSPLTPARLARQAGVSASHLNLLFRRHVGESPMKYIEATRVAHACRMLSAPYARINEIALACGYADVNYFVRVFKKHTGLPPGRWRHRRSRKDVVSNLCLDPGPALIDNPRDKDRKPSRKAHK